jgi:hypothetical protein
LTVNNVPPTASVSGPGTGVVGQVLTFTLGASDPSPVDRAAGFTYALDWGDGTAQAPDLQTFGPTGGNGSGLPVSHIYTQAGSYTVQVTATATDNDTSAPATLSQPITINPVTSANLQSAITGQPAPTVTIEAATPTDAQTVVTAVNGLNVQTAPVAVQIDLSSGSFTDIVASPPAGVTLILNGTGGGTIVGHSPALTVSSGNVVVTGFTITTPTDSPTILVTGGSLTLRNDTIQESTGFGGAAISVTGGTVDLGTSASPGGNTLNINGAGTFVHNSTSNPVAAVGDTFTVNGIPLAPSGLSGIVWEDFNDDGQVDFGEKGIGGMTVTLTGADDLGNAVNLSQLTDSDGAYVFLNLRPGNYSITETQPASYLQGTDSVGTAGGSLTAADQFFVQLGVQVNGLNYNYGERPAAGGGVHSGQTAGIGFWNNKNGQALLKALNGGSTSTQLGNWLAATLPNAFGIHAGSNNLTGKSNAAVAALFQSDFLQKGVKLDAQVLATALSVNVTNVTLDPTKVAAQYGFTVSGDGAGTATANVGGNGDAFGVADNSTLTLMDLLLATDAQAVNGLLYNGNTTKRNGANSVYSAVNQAGNIG